MAIFQMCDSSTSPGERKIHSVKEFVDSNFSKEWFFNERLKIAAKANEIEDGTWDFIN